MNEKMRGLSMDRLATLLLFIAIMLLGCDTDGDVGNVKTDFQWKYDTLRYSNKSEGVVVNKLWGSNRNSLYAIVSFPEKEILMRLANDKFVPVSLAPNRQGYLPDSVARVIYVDGISSSCIWVVGERKSSLGYKYKDSSYVAKWDGVSWKEYDLDAGFALFTVAAVDDKTFYASGNAAGIIYYSDGVEQFIAFPADIVDTPHASIFCTELYYSESILYASGYIRTPAGEYECFRVRYSGNEMVSCGLVSLDEDVAARSGFWRSDNGTLYSVGTKSIFKGSADTWEAVYTHDPDVRKIHGTSDRNYWIVGLDLCTQFVDGKEYQHNVAPPSDPPAQYSRIWTDGQMVVISYTDPSSSIGDIVLIGY